jgi:hypothetical protein
MKDMSRAIRRHHATRLKRARRFYFGCDNFIDLRRLGMLLNTATPCSCWMCGNPRHYQGRTLAELRHLAKLTEETQSS